MAEITVITAALGGIKHATDLVRLLRESSTSLEQAEQKFKLAELIETLAETRIQLADIQTLLREKDQKIKELEEAFESKDSFIKVKDAYYEIDPSGNAMGDPYCMHCSETNHKKCHLHMSHGSMHMCPSCKTGYFQSRTQLDYQPQTAPDSVIRASTLARRLSKSLEHTSQSIKLPGED